jgi:hypothetical protein
MQNELAEGFFLGFIWAIAGLKAWRKWRNRR